MLRGRAPAAVVCICLLASLALAAGGRASAQAPSDSAIVVTGNRHMDAAMIRAHFHAGADGRFDDAALDAALKSLYATGLFADVNISRQGERILVKVAENPTIARVALEGNRKISDDDLKKAVQSQAGGPLSRAIVHGDVERIIELYRQRGYFEVKVEPKTIAAGNGRRDLVFEINEGSKLAVRKVVFAGNAAVPANKLKGVIKTGESNLLSFLLNNDAYDADRIDEDRDLIRRFYRAHGYADVRVGASGSYDAGRKGVVVTFTIEEGEQYRFGKVEIVSKLPSVEAGALRRYLRTQESAVYDADAVEKTVSDMTLGLAKSGQPFATVLTRTERQPETRLITLVYVVQPGSRVYVERIDIHGNSKTRDEVIRREFDFVEGDAYNTALIERGERRLKALGYFKTVKISARPGSAPDRVVVNVALEEQLTGNFGINGGYSSSSGAMVEVKISESNFLGTGDVAKAAVTYGQYARGFDLAYIEPYFLGNRMSLGGDLFANQTLAGSYQAFDTTFYGAKFALTTPVTDELAVQWRYSIYNQGITLDPAEGPASLPLQQAAAAGPMWVSSIGNGITYSTLDNARNPTNGVRAQFDNELAGLGGAARFARTTNDIRFYHEVAGDVVGMVRTQSGYVTPWGGQSLPLLDGFFGGPQLVRGFAPTGFGPRDITPGTTQDNVGGNLYWTTSAELQSPMPFVTADAQLKVALFADAGSLWANNASNVASLASLSPSQQIANSRAPRASVGASLIWDSPFGPLRVDYAYPVAKQSYDITQRLNFSAGLY